LRFGFRRSRLTTSDLLAKLFFSMRFFLQETEADWLYRGTDNSFINFVMLPSFMRRLESSNRPRHSFTVLGNCIPLGCFLQGGSGYLMSRFAVVRFVAHADELLRATTLPEDLAFGRMLVFLNASMAAATTPAALGRRLGDTHLAALLAGRKSDLMPCNLQRWGCCRAVAGRLRDVVFYHDMAPGEKLRQGIRIAEAIFNADPSLFWVQTNEWPVMCTQNESTGLHGAV
jgi:hypothetical protein